MAVPFKNIPSGDQIRVPLFYAEVDNSQANTATQSQRALIIGQITTAGTGTPNTPTICQGKSDAKTVGGPGSMLALMTAAYRDSDDFGELWYLPLADDGSAVAANGSINFTAAATAVGVLFLYLAGQLVTQNVNASLTPAQLATALVATVNAASDLPVTAAVDGTTTSKVNFTAKNTVDATFTRTAAGDYSISLRETDVQAFQGQATAAAAASDVAAAAASAAVTAIKTLK
ncbi:hypothetical protein [Paraburkholderia dioscoreae]|uniref:Bacteriophage tail sheath protein GpL, Mu-like protein n=1 Tax=Paraburkholderia dioscoreae TaxID=2604047 RepID=A0A5Q4ZBT1_9BURK